MRPKSPTSMSAEVLKAVCPALVPASMATSTAAARLPATAVPRTISRTRTCTAELAARRAMESATTRLSRRTRQASLVLLRLERLVALLLTRSVLPGFAAPVVTSAVLA